MRTLLLAALAFALATSARADPAAWRVTHAGPGELLLLGSVHYLRDRDYPLPQIVDELYGRADALVMELDMDDLDPLAAQSQFMSAAMLPAGRSLEDVLEPDAYRRAREGAADLNVDLALLERFEPWLVAITLMDLGMGQRGYRADRGLEQHLVALAAADGKTILGLESLESQIRIFDELPPAQQQSLLEQTLAELDGPDAVMDELVAAWRDGSLDALARELMDDFEDYPGLYEKLVEDRNTAWILELERLLDRSGTFLVVVGALHLVGEDSVVDLLRQRGFEVARLRSP